MEKTGLSEALIVFMIVFAFVVMVVLAVILIKKLFGK